MTTRRYDPRELSIGYMCPNCGERPRPGIHACRVTGTAEYTRAEIEAAERSGHVVQPPAPAPPAVCPDCKGTGVYVGLGFYAAEPCKACQSVRVLEPAKAPALQHARAWIEIGQGGVSTLCLPARRIGNIYTATVPCDVSFTHTRLLDAAGYEQWARSSHNRIDLPAGAVLELTL